MSLHGVPVWYLGDYSHNELALVVASSVLHWSNESGPRARVATTFASNVTV